MIKQFVLKWEENKNKLKEKYSTTHPESYDSILKDVISIVTSEGDYDDFNPDPKRIHVIDDGDYQGTRLFVIGAKGYQPSDYWYVNVSYGSCSGCDTFQSICDYSDEAPNAEQVEGYMTLALHFVQGLKKMGDENE